MLAAVYTRVGVAKARLMSSPIQLYLIPNPMLMGTIRVSYYRLFISL